MQSFLRKSDIEASLVQEDYQFAGGSFFMLWPKV
jgi:hypothetical protein